jgi:predicted transcriptional regulator
MAKKDRQVSGYVDQQCADRLQSIADDQNRTLSNLIATVLYEYVATVDQPKDEEAKGDD